MQRAKSDGISLVPLITGVVRSVLGDSTGTARWPGAVERVRWQAVGQLKERSRSPLGVLKSLIGVTTV
jgi:hypothetical protein